METFPFGNELLRPGKYEKQRTASDRRLSLAKDIPATIAQCQKADIGYASHLIMEREIVGGRAAS